MPRGKSIQGSLFEEDYLLRTLGSIVNSPDVALTELVANAWDAGASRVEIELPTQYDKELSISDDGSGLTFDQFSERWMKLGYDRVRHQGQMAESVGSTERKRRAFGRNGVGRHGMLCFANKYEVETSRDGIKSTILVTTASGKEPFTASLLGTEKAKRHGTTLRTIVGRNLPSEDRIRRVLSARYLHDPEFSVRVNGISVPLASHEGLVDHTSLRVADAELEVFVIDSTQTARTAQQHGIAFWVGGRLVGEPSWTVAGNLVVDGRTTVAKRHTIVVRTDDLFGDVLPDWSSFRQTERVAEVMQAVVKHVNAVVGRLSKEKVRETAETALRENSADLRELRDLAKLEVQDFVTEVATAQPTIAPEVLSAAVQAVISLEKSRSGQALLQKISLLSEDDVEGLNRLLENWTIRDALTVLDEIDRRVAVVEALERLSGDKKVDELHTLHPLVTQARWLFGAEFDSPLYASNISIRRAIERVFRDRISPTKFANARNRPDLIALADATLSAVACDEVDQVSGVSRTSRVLLVELKKGGFRITRKEMDQAAGYVEDLLNCGLVDGTPYVHAFVVGDEIDAKLTPVRLIGEHPVKARIDAITFGQLVRTASQRLFRLREELSTRYDKVESLDLVRRALGEPTSTDIQTSLPLISGGSAPSVREMSPRATDEVPTRVS